MLKIINYLVLCLQLFFTSGSSDFFPLFNIIEPDYTTRHENVDNS